MNNIKILITGIASIDKSIIAKRLVEIDDSLTIIPHFTSNVDMKDNISEFEYFLDTHTIHLAYKNNSIMTVYTNNYTSNGITIDDFYNNDICYLTVEEFNSIPEVIFRKYDILVIWVDTKNHKTISNADLIEINYFSTFITSINYLYFLENETNIHTVILDYIFGDEEKRKYLLEENN